MTCCKSTSMGVGIPTTAPTNNDPDIYIEQPSGQIWIWNGTQWTKPPVGSVSYNSTTHVLTVGSSSVTLPIATKTEYGLVKLDDTTTNNPTVGYNSTTHVLTVGSSSVTLPVASTTEYGVVKLADPATDPNNPIIVRPDGTIGIDCTKLTTHCDLATKTELQNVVKSLPAGLPPAGAAGGMLTGTYPNPGLNFTKKDGTPHTAGGCIMSCAETLDAIEAALVDAFIGGQEVVTSLQSNLTINSNTSNEGHAILAITVPTSGIVQASAGAALQKSTTYDLGYNFDIVLNGGEEIASELPYFPTWLQDDYATVTSRFIQVNAGDVITLFVNPRSGTAGRPAVFTTKTNLKLKYLSVL